MSVVFCKEERKYSTGNMALGNPPTQQSVRFFHVNTSASTDDDYTALNAVDPNTSVSIPLLGDSHPTRPWLTCSSLSCNVMDENAGRNWQVLATYTILAAAIPWDQPPVYSVTQDQQTIPVYYDVVSGNLIANSAGVPYNPPPNFDRANTTLNIAVNLLDFSYSTVAGYVDCVNSVSFFGFAKDTVRCLGIPYTTATYVSPFNGSPTEYYQVSFTFGIKNPNVPNWQDQTGKLLDWGTYQLVSGSLCPIILPNTGAPATENVMLNGSGVYAGVGASPVWNQFKGYYEVDLNALSSYW